jgi:hypothetical protein
MTYNDLGCWANMRLAFIKQHRLQLYQSLLKENRLHSYLVEFDSKVRDTLILTEEGELIAARDSMGRLPVLIGTETAGSA